MTQLSIDYRLQPDTLYNPYALNPVRNAATDRSDTQMLDLRQVGLAHLSDDERGCRHDRFVHALACGDRPVEVLSARVLEELLKEPQVLPPAWRTYERVYFYGTTFVDDEGQEYVVYLEFRGERLSYGCELTSKPLSHGHVVAYLEPSRAPRESEAAVVFRVESKRRAVPLSEGNVGFGSVP